MSRRNRTKSDGRVDFSTKALPADTAELRRELESFLGQSLADWVQEPPRTKSGKPISIGAVKFGVYALFDYDGEPIYVGQSRERVGGRVGRHLTNQRTDAVAMSVLDPFEVREVELWLLPQYQDVKGNPKDVPEARLAADHLNALERTVFLKLIRESRFKAILNEKDPPEVPTCELPLSVRGVIVSKDVQHIREHPDVRIARRAQTIARLAQIIAGRDVKAGLRRALATQAARLNWIARERFEALGGERAVEARSADETTDDEGN